jgi:hypothetical protein
VRPQAGVGELRHELAGQVEVGGGEPLRPAGRVAVLALADVALDDRLEPRLVEEAAQQPVVGRREPRDRRRRHHAAGAQHAPRLRQRGDPVGPAGQVVEGTEQEHGVDAGVGAVQSPRLADRGARQRRGRLAGGGLQRLLDVARHRVDQCTS